MTSMTRGPLQPGVYWRRRVFVLGLVLALGLIVVNLVRGGDEDARDAAPTAVTVAGEPASTPSGADTDGLDLNKRGKVKGSHQEHESRATEVPEPTTVPPSPVLADPVGQCADDDVAVTPEVVGGVAGQPVTITLGLRTLSSEACTWRVSANHLTVKVSSGTEEVWASRECPGQVPKANVVVRKAATSTLDLVWNGQVADTGCPRVSDYVEAGDYGVAASAFGAEPGEATFELGAPAPTRLQDTSKKQTKTNKSKSKNAGQPRR